MSKGRGRVPPFLVQEPTGSPSPQPPGTTTAPPSHIQDFDTADALLAAIENNDPEVSPSLLYATAACLEGCSFVNGGSQNTLCPALEELARQNKCYVLGTDFKVPVGRGKSVWGKVLVFLGGACDVWLD